MTFGQDGNPDFVVKDKHGVSVYEYYFQLKKEVFVVDLDPSLHAALKFAYKGVRGRQGKGAQAQIPNSMLQR